MEDIVELSSDSNDTIINPVDANLYDLSPFEDKESAFENIYDKKIVHIEKENILESSFPYSRKNSLNHLSNDEVSSETTSNSNDADNLLKELYAKYLPVKSDSGTNYQTQIKSSENLKRKLSDEPGTTESHSKQNITKKQMMEIERNKRKLEQQNKKILLEKEKELKKTLKQIQKSSNPDECLKNIIVRIDETLHTDCGEELVEQLKNNNISYTYLQQKCKNVLSWVRKIQTLENLISENPVKDEPHFLLVLPSSEFKSLVRKNSLNSYIHSISLQLQFRHLTIAIFGLEKPNDEEENAIMETEIFYKCYWQCVKKIDQLASLIFTITKAVAQLPYKLEKQKKYELQNEFFADTNKDTVRVDKNGNGLTRLWNQMLTMLPLARLETAEAISNVYPTPASLFMAYEECELDKEGLIQNLPIKRANGPIATFRKIGPELSKKCANYFTASVNITI